MRSRPIGLTVALALAALGAACGSSTTSSSSSSTPTTAPARGPVDVLYAGSLVNLMERDLGPKFTAAAGYQFSGFGAGSAQLANQIKGGVRQADVFISASPQVNATLEGAGNGDWVNWYASFAKGNLVLGYNPNSRFAAQLRTEPWDQVITRPGLQLGRTDPALDPKGQLTVQALTQAADVYHDPALLSLTKTTTGVFPEETLVGRLQAGQLDAGFFYSNEAREAGIPTVTLGAVQLSATYTVTVLNRAPHASGAVTFVNYLLGTKGQGVLTSHGLTLIKPPLMAGSGVPASLRPVLSGS
ncbi:MAG TPA: extracellular solute-binding protein [Acidimicrobiales bacterium]|nr:extracellular solute-binding protein [Acidimicrobiales bacterium]